MANREKKIANKVDTEFCLGSMNKMFTAVAVLQLVQAGKLSLDGTLADYWPDYPNHDLASRVNVGTKVVVINSDMRADAPARPLISAPVSMRLR